MSRRISLLSLLMLRDDASVHVLIVDWSLPATKSVLLMIEVGGLGCFVVCGTG